MSDSSTIKRRVAEDTMKRLDEIELEEFNLRREILELLEQSNNRTGELREIRKRVKV